LTNRTRLAAAGFAAVDVIDAAAPCLGGFRWHLAGWAGTERRAGLMKLPRSLAVAVASWLVARFFGLICRTYLLVSARKVVPCDLYQ